MALDLHKRILSAEVQSSKAGSQVIVAGWASEVKSLGKIAFIKLRDREGYLQLVSTDFKLIGRISKLTNESVIIASGKVQKSKAKAGGNELELKDFEVLSLAEPKLPIDMSGKIETDLSKRLDYRVLDLKNPKNLAIFKIRSQANASTRDFLLANGFIEMQTPKLVAAGTEGGATLFQADYYGKKVFLSQSQQLYKQYLLAAGFDRVFEIGPSFRAEKSHTMRHLTEFTHFDFEMAFIKDEDDVLKVLEQWFVFLLKDLKVKCKKELELLGTALEIPKLPFPRVTYEECLKLLSTISVKLKFGNDIGTDDEKKVGELVKKKYKTNSYFITKYPFGLKPFYIMTDGEVSRGFDFEYEGEELASGGQREHRVDILTKQIKGKGLNPKDFEFYLMPFRYGMPPHGGFGLGIDRLIRYILKLENIREAVLFPRDPERLMP
ncbi:MAG: aspartate--tRNA(Asn) ligase [DPANN group archaeon]|nr:aspartate--tRNA(Asn) ligase [DPANN group archaeon]